MTCDLIKPELRPTTMIEVMILSESLWLFSKLNNLVYAKSEFVDTDRTDTLTNRPYQGGISSLLISTCLDRSQLLNDLKWSTWSLVKRIKPRSYRVLNSIERSQTTGISLDSLSKSLPFLLKMSFIWGAHFQWL